MSLVSTSTEVAVDEPHIAFHDVNFTLDRSLSRDEWVELGEHLGTAAKGSRWWVGDWVNYGEHEWGETYAEAERLTGLSVKTLEHYARVSRAFEIPRRRGLSWSHHAEVAAMPADLADRLLDAAETNQWNRDEMRLEARKVRLALDAAKDSHDEDDDEDDEPEEQPAVAPTPSKPVKLSVSIQVAPEDVEAAGELIERLVAASEGWLRDKGIDGKVRAA